MELTNNDIYNIIINLGLKLKKEKDFLSDLDEKIGDGDFGININRAFDSITDNINKNMSINEIFSVIGTDLMAKHGGTSGTLLGMAFTKYSKNDIQKFDEREFVNYLFTLNETIRKLGKAKIGDKTMIDSLEPAYTSARESLEQNNNLIKIIKNARDAAEYGMKFSINIESRKGRSSYIGDRSIGYQDPGCTFIFYMLDSFYKSVSK